MSYKRIPIRAGRWGYRGTDALYHETIGEDTPALTAFDLTYLNGDHHVQTLMAGGKTGDSNSFLLGLGDGDNGILGNERDPVDLKAIYYAISAPHLTPGSERSISGSSSNRQNSNVAIPRLAEDEIFVLRGFEFQGTPGRNHHLRKVGVRYNSIRGEIRIDFVDNSPQDDRYTYTIRYFVLKRWCDRNWLCLRGIYSQTFEFINSASILKTNRGNALLAGFNFEFMDDDHHLRRIAVNVQPMNEIAVAFTDSEANHRVKASIDYVVLDWSDAYR